MVVRVDVQLHLDPRSQRERCPVVGEPRLLTGDQKGAQLGLGVEHRLHEPRVRLLGGAELLGEGVDGPGRLVDGKGADDPDEAIATLRALAHRHSHAHR